MAVQLIIFAALVAFVRAGILQAVAPAVAYSSQSTIAHTAPAAQAVTYAAAAVAPAVAVHAAPVTVELDAPANYQFSYGVNDPHTGDNKQQQETRQGDIVQGSYSLAEADGTRRIVHYTADPHNGFNAVVQRQGTPIQQIQVAAAPAIVTTRLAAAQPITATSYAAGHAVSSSVVHG